MFGCLFGLSSDTEFSFMASHLSGVGEFHLILRQCFLFEKILGISNKTKYRTTHHDVVLWWPHVVKTEKLKIQICKIFHISNIWILYKSRNPN